MIRRGWAHLLGAKCGLALGDDVFVCSFRRGTGFDFDDAVEYARASLDGS